MRVVLRLRHDTGCRMAKRPEPPWVIDRNRTAAWLDRRGGGTGRTTLWIRLRCNDPDCPALAIVHHQDLMELVDKELP